MLPSTGYFKGINCPFYESGTCDRPYCHFKHSKREDAGVTTEVAETVENRSTGQVQESKVSRMVTEGLKADLTSGSPATLDSSLSSMVEKRTDASSPVNKSLPCVYNPTPIAELRKRHIPIVSYMPTRESRVAVKRKCSPEGLKSWLDVGTNDAVESQTAEIKYKPTLIVSSETRDTVQSYVPTCKLESPSSILCKDGTSNEYLLKLGESYYPKSKKRREEYVPKKIKTPLKTPDGSNGSALDDYVSEFGTLDRVLVCPKPNSVVDLCEVSQDSCIDIEPKFSDDDDDNSNSRDGIEDDSRDASRIDSAQIDYHSSEQGKSCSTPKEPDLGNNARDSDGYLSKNVGNDDSADEDKYTDKVLTSCTSLKPEQLPNEETLKASQIGKDKLSDIASNKDIVDSVEEHRGRDKSKSKDQKDRGVPHKRCKDRCDSGEKSRSSSHGRSKSRCRLRHESKDTKDKKRDSYRSKHKDREKHRDRESDKNKDKDKDKDKDKGKGKGKGKDKDKDKSKERSESRYRAKRDGRDHRASGKHDDSKILSKSQEHAKGRSNGSSKRSKSEYKFGGKINEKSYVLTGKAEGSVSAGGNDLEDEYNRHRSDITDSYIDVVFSTSDSDHDVQEECLKIFQEYQIPERSKSVEMSKDLSSVHDKEKESNEEMGRKRVAHASAATCVTRQSGVHRHVRKLVNPQQKMYERWRMLRDAAAEKTALASSSVSKDVRRNCSDSTTTTPPPPPPPSPPPPPPPPTTTTATTTTTTTATTATTTATATATTTTSNSEIRLNGNGRVRIAHVPYAKSLKAEKRKLAENVGRSGETRATDSSKTAAQTAKSGVRVAHVPQVVPQLIRPEPLHASTQKFPLNVRQYYVNTMHDVCMLIYTNLEDAAQRAVKEEYACYEKCKALAVYKNSCMLAAYRLRKETDQNSSADYGAVATAANSVISHEAVLSGKTRGTWSVLKTKKSVTEFRGAALYNMLKKWIMSEQQLRDNGFPRPHPDGQKGRAKVYVTNSRNQTILSKVPNERICIRCGQNYMINKKGFALDSQNCIYHWGRKFTIRGEGKYSCCQQYGSATGCCDAKTHVWDYTDYENLRGYVRTLPKDTPVEEQGVYALDCEMCYTTQGLELTRITVIDDECSVVYETLVRPDNPIIDYNTRFSGITEESMKDVTTTLLDVQAALLTMFSEKTILVGHSLESDFKALRLLHETVVDTSVMFPHKNGYPQKRALKNLCSEYLRKLIQNEVGGHDSKEDAVACMELILWKAKEEAKLQ